MKFDLRKQFTLINLPSKGVYYENEKKSLYVRYLTATEEMILCDGMLNDSGLAIQLVLNNIIIDDDIRAEDLIISDLQAILIFLRSTAFGDDVELSFNCSHCGQESSQSIKLSRLDWKNQEYIPGSDGMFTVELPISNKVLKIKPVFFKDVLQEKEEVEDDFIIIKDLDGDIKIKKESTSKLLDSIHEYDGITNRDMIKHNLNNTSRKDITLLKDFLSKNENGVIEEYNFSCEYCHESSVSKIGFGYNFLSLPVSYKENVLEELFLITYYSKGVNMEDAYTMPTFHRRWHLNRIKEELDKKNKSEREASNRARSQSRSSRL